MGCHHDVYLHVSAVKFRHFWLPRHQHILMGIIICEYVLEIFTVIKTLGLPAYFPEDWRNLGVFRD